MRPSFQHLGFENAEGSFLSYQVSSDHFGFHWHYHYECEISFVLNGYGTRLVGDNVSPFEQGDFLFIGSNLPHTLISDDHFKSSDEKMEVLVVQFHPELFDTKTIDVEELSMIGKLIKESKRGLSFANSTPEVTLLMQSMMAKSGLDRYLVLLELLNKMSGMEYDYLASMFYEPMLSDSSEERISRVCAFIHDHFSSEINIGQLASLANMNESAFCRFFRKMTGKTAIEYINDLRLGMACRLLQNDQYKINEIAYKIGFNTVPYFNRYFKKVKNCSPSEFRKFYGSGR